MKHIGGKCVPEVETAIPLLERSHVNFDLIYFSVRTNVEKRKRADLQGPTHFRHFSREMKRNSIKSREEAPELSVETLM